jgi:hypothetical protein
LVASTTVAVSTGCRPPPKTQLPASWSLALRRGPHQPPVRRRPPALRGLLLGTGIGSDGIVAVAWCVGITLFGYVSAKRLYDRDPTAA